MTRSSSEIFHRRTRISVGLSTLKTTEFPVYKMSMTLSMVTLTEVGCAARMSGRP